MNRNNLTCIDLDQPGHEGFREFISCWLYRDDDLCFIVDPGPLSTIPHLLQELTTCGVERLDFILLTHIHIDHAGGTGALLEHFPKAQVICHPEGVRHMIAPEKLWLGSLKVLGSLAETFGEIIPVPANRIGAGERLTGSGIDLFLTPGHAPHHVCYRLDDLLVGGEVAGVRADIARGIYMRPATPPRFMLEVALDSLDRMIALAPHFLIIAHHGLVEPAVEYLQIARRQLPLWVRGVLETSGDEGDARKQVLFDWLLKRDPNFANFDQLATDIQARERHFFGNTLRGMQEYADQLAPEQKQSLLTGTS